MKAEGKLVAPVADWETKRGWVSYAFGELERAGYTVGSAYTAVKDPARTHFVLSRSALAGADLLSLGVASFGYVGGTHYQNHHDFEPYVARVQAGELPVYRALTPNAEERFIREFILQLKLGQVSRAYFQQKFDIEPAEHFAQPLQRLKDWGFLSIGGRSDPPQPRRLAASGSAFCMNFSSPNIETLAMPDRLSPSPAAALPFVYPLDDFYAGAGLRLPNFERLTGEQVPEPYRSLLVHENDMTPTLQQFHRANIHLKILGRAQRDDFYFREVVLQLDGGTNRWNSCQ